MAKVKYPLESLLGVRYYREDNAKKGVNNAKREVQEAEQNIILTQQKLDDYRIWRVKEEDRRYAEIMGIICTLDDLESLKQNISHLMMQEIHLEEEVENAKKNLAIRKKELETAKKILFDAQKDIMKIHAHKDLWKTEAEKEDARLEDLEMEEFKLKDVNEFE